MDYFDVKGFESSSSIKAFEELYTGRKSIEVTPERQKEIFAEGTLLDFLITEPHRVNRKTFTIENDHESITFSKKKFDCNLKMADAFFNHSLASTILANGIPQKEFYRTVTLQYKREKFKVKIKCKLDIYSKVYSCDIKSTAATSSASFINSMLLFKQNRQGAIYTDMAKNKGIFYIGIQKIDSLKKTPKVFDYLIEPTGKIDTKGLYQKGKASYIELLHKKQYLGL